MKDYSNFTENDVVDIRGLNEEQLQCILDLNPKNDCSIRKIGNADFYRPLGRYGRGSYGTFEMDFTLDCILHPASDFLPQEKPTFKRGDLIKVWGNNENMAVEMIGLTFVDGAEYPVVCVNKYDEEKFRNNELFRTLSWKHWKPITENPRIKEIEQQIEALKKELETIKD